MIFYVALTDIEAAELRIDYGNSYWQTMLRYSARRLGTDTQHSLGKNAISQLPLYSLYSRTTCEVIPPSEPIYLHLASELHRTRSRHEHQGLLHKAPRYEVDRIEHICTPRLQAKYLTEVQDIIGLCNKGGLNDRLLDVDALRVHSYHGLDLNEFMLFHGADSKLIDRLTKQGLDPRYAGKHRGKMFGAGVYFATNSSKSDNYTKPDAQGLRCLLVVRVCLGEPHRADQKDHTIKLPPDRADSRGPKNSVIGLVEAEGGPLKFREYVVYKETQSLPQFAIWYRHSEGCQCTHCGL